MKRVTIKDIATRLGLSVSTVSRALSGDTLVREQTREEVVRVAEEMGYRRNPLAASLRSGRGFVIGVMVPEVLWAYSTEIIRGVQKVSRKNGFSIIIKSSDESKYREGRNMENLKNVPIDGLLISAVDGETNVKELLSLKEAGVQIVFCDRIPAELESKGFSFVGMQNQDKAFFLIEHMIRAGRRRIVHLCGNRSVKKYDSIYRGYREALEKHNIPFDKELVMTVENSVLGGRLAAEQLLEKGVEFDSVFAFGDMPAIGFMNRMMENGAKVPDDLAVAGFSGSPLSKFTYPSLTTVEPDLEQMGRRAAELLIEHIKNPTLEPENITVDSKIKLRTSSHPADQQS